jgi:predicted flap endonuclease-1-like 5' DNA nuclease
MRSYRIEEIEGIGPAYAAKLAPAGVKTTRDLLKRCADRKGRKHLAEATAISEKRLLEWANLADLMRIRGIGRQFAELLEAAGVDTVRELRHRKAGNLAEKLSEVQKAKRLTRATPGAVRVQRWIDEAQATEPLITY